MPAPWVTISVDVADLSALPELYRASSGTSGYLLFDFIHYMSYVCVKRSAHVIQLSNLSHMVVVDLDLQFSPYHTNR